VIKVVKIIDFALCIARIDDETDFELAKIYPVIDLLSNDPKDYLRVVDESGEDYLYPAEYFQIVNLTEQSQANLRQYYEPALA
jgi:hypothetical protein